MRGLLWFIRHYGLRCLLRYERDRRRGVVIDYAQVFTPDELAILEEHGLSTWGKPCQPKRKRTT